MKVVSSVGLILFNPEGKILLLKELESKIHYGKLAGMLSVPIETIEEGEVVSQTFRRLLIEEIGVPIKGRLDYFKRIFIRLNGNYTERVFTYFGVSTDSFVANPKDTDIEHFGWMSPQEILNLSSGQRRLEVEPLLRSYLGC